MSHILYRVRCFPRDPDAAQEAVAYCGETEECTGSGRHSMLAASPDILTAAGREAHYICAGCAWRVHVDTLTFGGRK